MKGKTVCKSNQIQRQKAGWWLSEAKMPGTQNAPN